MNAIEQEKLADNYRKALDATRENLALAERELDKVYLSGQCDALQDIVNDLEGRPTKTGQGVGATSG